MSLLADFVPLASKASVALTTRGKTSHKAPCVDDIVGSVVDAADHSS